MKALFPVKVNTHLEVKLSFFLKLYCTPLLHASGSGLGTGKPMSKHYLLLYSHTRKDRVRERERVRERRKKKKRIVRDKIC